MLRRIYSTTGIYCCFGEECDLRSFKVAELRKVPEDDGVRRIFLLCVLFDGLPRLKWCDESHATGEELFVCGF